MRKLPVNNFFFLICLSLFREDPPTLKELSELMGTSHQNVKQIALKLERKGFISILRDKTIIANSAWPPRKNIGR